jgi:hypothetical protein
VEVGEDLVKAEVEGGVRRPFFIGQDLETFCGWWLEAEEAEEARATQFISRRTVETAGVRRFPCRDPAGRERRERTAEAEMGPTREGADPGGTEEILAAGQVWEEAKVEACYTRLIVWTDRLTLRF